MIIDTHFNLRGAQLSDGDPANLIAYMDRWNVDKVVCQRVIGTGAVFDTAKAAEQYEYLRDFCAYAPDRFLGMVAINPFEGKPMLELLRKAYQLEHMIGFKLWLAARCSEGALEPFVKLTIKHNKLCMIHTMFKNACTREWSLSRPPTGKSLPLEPERAFPEGQRSDGMQKAWCRESWPCDVIELAARHPEAKIVMFHFGGQFDAGPLQGKRAPQNVCMGGSNGQEMGTYEHAVDCFGAGRIVWGTDNRRFSSMGCVLEARISEAAKRMILGDNFRRLIES